MARAERRTAALEGVSLEALSRTRHPPNRLVRQAARLTITYLAVTALLIASCAKTPPMGLRGGAVVILEQAAEPLPALPPLAFFLLLFSGWINRQQQAVIDYLHEENGILRTACGPDRVRLSDDQRRRLAVKGKALGQRIHVRKVDSVRFGSKVAYRGRADGGFIGRAFRGDVVSEISGIWLRPSFRTARHAERDQVGKVKRFHRFVPLKHDRLSHVAVSVSLQPAAPEREMER